MISDVCAGDTLQGIMPVTREDASLLVKQAAKRNEVSRKEKGMLLGLIDELPPVDAEPRLFRYLDKEDILDTLIERLPKSSAMSQRFHA